MAEKFDFEAVDSPTTAVSSPCVRPAPPNKRSPPERPPPLFHPDFQLDDGCVA